MTKTTSPRPFVFVLMPFDESFDDEYELAIKPACGAAGAYAERVDEQIFSGSILDRIYNQIAKADVVIADLTGRNPNVFYEIGYAHALGKTTLLLTRSADDIPFDLRHYPHIIHEGRLADLRVEVERRIRWHLENPAKVDPRHGTLAVRVAGTFLVGSPTIEIPINVGHSGFAFRLDFHNQIDRTIQVIEFQVGLLTETFFSSSLGGNTSNTVIRIEDRNLHLLGQMFAVLPGAWETTEVSLWVDNELDVGGTHEFCLRAFFEAGIEDFPFSIKFVETAS